MKTDFNIQANTEYPTETYLFIGINILESRDEVNLFIGQLLNEFKNLEKFREDIIKTVEEKIEIVDYISFFEG